jgi:DNA-binding NarL/FixJ family response regulator
VEVLALATDADQLLDQVATHHPDVAIVDIRMPPSHTDEGLRAAVEIRRPHPGIAVLVLSQHLTVHYALDLLADGAQGIGYLLKDRVGIFESSPTPCTGSPQGAPRWIPKWLPTSSATSAPSQSAS